MRPRLLAPTLAILTTFAATARSSAEYVTLVYDGRTANPNVQVTANGVTYDGTAGKPKIPTGPFYWHENELPPNAAFPPPTTTFCIEINPAGQPLPTVGAPTDFAVLSVSTLSNAAAITELYGRYYNNEPGKNWEDPTILGGSFNGSTNSTAFQIALWELIYDGNKNLSDGNFRATGLGGVSTTAQNWLNSLNGDTSMFNSRFGDHELVVLRAPAGGDKSQDQIQDQLALRPKTAVPAPPGVILAGLGFLALLGGRAGWLRRRPAI